MHMFQGKSQGKLGDEKSMGRSLLLYQIAKITPLVEEIAVDIDAVWLRKAVRDERTNGLEVRGRFFVDERPKDNPTVVFHL